MIPAIQRGDPQWSELRVVGVGWWIRNINTLRTDGGEGEATQTYLHTYHYLHKICLWIIILIETSGSQ